MTQWKKFQPNSMIWKLYGKLWSTNMWMFQHIIFICVYVRIICFFCLNKRGDRNNHNFHFAPVTHVPTEKYTHSNSQAYIWNFLTHLDDLVAPVLGDVQKRKRKRNSIEIIWPSSLRFTWLFDYFIHSFSKRYILFARMCVFSHFYHHLFITRCFVVHYSSHTHTDT